VLVTAFRPPRRLRVEHRTHFGYDRTVAASYNECRIQPHTEPRQQILESHVTIEPCTWRYEYIDYWTTSVIAFEVRTPHDTLTVTGTTVADIAEAADPPQIDWTRLRSPQTTDAFAESLVATARTEPVPEVVELATEAAAGKPPHEAARAVSDAITAVMEYAPGSTSVQTPAADAWAARRGVCQDFAHLAVGAMHSVGIPGRYVSGYVQSHPKADIGETVSGQSHAWIEWWTGGWYGWDPTSGQPVGSGHLAVGRGRDYGDVPPVRGIVSSAGQSRLDVSVTVTRLR
jgi:transglutaminase-like putative cysteine protease